MNNTTKPFLRMIFILIIAVAVVGGLIWKANNPNDYRHPRDRAIKLY